MQIFTDEANVRIALIVYRHTIARLSMSMDGLWLQRIFILYMGRLVFWLEPTDALERHHTPHSGYPYSLRRSLLVYALDDTHPRFMIDIHLYMYILHIRIYAYEISNKNTINCEFTRHETSRAFGMWAMRKSGWWYFCSEWWPLILEEKDLHRIGIGVKIVMGM